MKKDLKVILDTNIFISSLLKGPLFKEIFDLFEKETFRLIISAFIIEEIRTVLSIKEFSQIQPSEIRWMFETINEKSEIFFPKSSLTLCRDPKDNPILELALESNADFLVTGDKDLLVLKKIKKTAIITPKEFIKLLKKR